MNGHQQNELRVASRMHLLPEDDRIVGEFRQKPDANPPGIWGAIGSEIAYFGPHFDTALFTATQGDWWVPERDGAILPEDIDWLVLRAQLGDEWKDLQMRSQFAASRTRLYLNYQNIQEI